MSKCYLAGGCFWCIESVFDTIDGVTKVVSGYCGNDSIIPNYELVKAQQTNYREALEITFVDNEISYDKILEVFFENVDLFDGQGQYIDRGNSYTLAIYYISDSQKKIAMDKLSMLEDKYGKKPEISVERFEKFFAAEDYHQKYYLKNPQSFEEELKISGRKKEK